MTFIWLVSPVMCTNDSAALMHRVQCKPYYPAGALPQGFEWGNGFQLGRCIQVSQSHLPPNFDFSSCIAHVILEILENLKILANIQKISFEHHDFLGHPPEFQTGGTYPHHPPPQLGCQCYPVCPQKFSAQLHYYARHIWHNLYFSSKGDTHAHFDNQLTM